MLSNASKYAIRAMLYLAQNSNPENKIGAKLIAKALETPQPFLAKILQQLATNMIISSSKGPTGGFYLSDDNKQNYLWDIIVCIDGGHKFEQCYLGLSKCDSQNPCPVHHIVLPFKEKILTTFKGKTINDLVKEMDEDGSIISLKGF
jgi:Rrf2 family transcriptional regulator, iron-sulfur cluster assembly transcription factor